MGSAGGGRRPRRWGRTQTGRRRPGPVDPRRTGRPRGRARPPSASRRTTLGTSARAQDRARQVVAAARRWAARTDGRLWRSRIQRWPTRRSAASGATRRADDDGVVVGKGEHGVGEGSPRGPVADVLGCGVQQGDRPGPPARRRGRGHGRWDDHEVGRHAAQLGGHSCGGDHDRNRDLRRDRTQEVVLAHAATRATDVRHLVGDPQHRVVCDGRPPDETRTRRAPRPSWAQG